MTTSATHAAAGVVAGLLCFVLGVVVGRRGRPSSAAPVVASLPRCEACGRLMAVPAFETTTVNEQARGIRSFVPGLPYCTTLGCQRQSDDQKRTARQ